MQSEQNKQESASHEEYTRSLFLINRNDNNDKNVSQRKYSVVTVSIPVD